MDEPNLRLEWRTAEELDDNPSNWRSHPKHQMEALSGVLKEVGWAGAALYNDTTGRLIDGHARKKVAKDQKIPVLVGSWTEEQEKLILATLDPLAGQAGVEREQLESLLRGVQTANQPVADLLSKLAQEEGIIPKESFASIEGDAESVDVSDELRDKWNTGLGQVWFVAGKQEHRLICADAGDKAEIGRLMGGDRVDLVVTSPPYANQREYKSEISDWDHMMQGVFGNVPASDGAQVLVNLGLIHRNNQWVEYYRGWLEWMESIGWRRFGWYVWDQGFGLPGDWNGRFAPSHEWVFHFNKQAKQPTKWCEKQRESIKPANESTMRGKDGKTKPFTNPAASGQPTKVPDSVIRLNRQVGSDGHPAQYPVSLPSAFILSWHGTVYDPFLGSGTTMVAAEQLDRKCYGVEISPEYVAVVLERMTKLGCECRLAEDTG